MTKPHNPPAFPVATASIVHQEGATLRDLFAAAALQGLIAKYGNESSESAANYAYDFADAMLKAREVENE